MLSERRIIESGGYTREALERTVQAFKREANRLRKEIRHNWRQTNPELIDEYVELCERLRRTTLYLGEFEYLRNVI